MPAPASPSPPPAGPAGRPGPGHRRPGRPVRRSGAGVVALVALLAVAGCGLRLESGPPPLPSPGPDDVARQAAARGAEALADLATQVRATTADDADEAPLLDRLAAEATHHVSALGGVWRPPAWATPTESPGEELPAGLAGVVESLTTQAERTCADASAVGEADLATILASMCLAQDAARADLLAGTGREETSTTAGRSVDPEALVEDLVGTGEAVALAGALDAAAFALEVSAARASGGDRQDLRARAAALRSESVVLLTAADVLGTAADPRRAAYELPDAWTDDGVASLAATVETGVLAAWAAVVADAAPDVRAGVLDRMGTAYDQARRWGAPAQPLPGLD